MNIATVTQGTNNKGGTITDYRNIKDIAREVKQELMKQYPDCKWSTRIKRFSGGQSLTVTLMSAPFEAFASDKDCNGNDVRGYAQLNQYQFSDQDEERVNNGTPLTKEAWDCMAKAFRVASKDNWNKSDSQTDYFNVNYWLHLEIGKWDKPFIAIASH